MGLTPSGLGNHIAKATTSTASDNEDAPSSCPGASCRWSAFAPVQGAEKVTLGEGVLTFCGNARIATIRGPAGSVEARAGVCGAGVSAMIGTFVSGGSARCWVKFRCTGNVRISTRSVRSPLPVAPELTPAGPVGVRLLALSASGGGSTGETAAVIGSMAGAALAPAAVRLGPLVEEPTPARESTVVAGRSVGSGPGDPAGPGRPGTAGGAGSVVSVPRWGGPC